MKRVRLNVAMATIGLATLCAASAPAQQVRTARVPLPSSFGIWQEHVTRLPPIESVAREPVQIVPIGNLKSAPKAKAKDHSTVVPKNFKPWWQDDVTKPLRSSPSPISVSVNSLIMQALRYSAYVRAISDNALVAETAITKTDAEFDVHTFMETKFVRTSIPTGSVLEAGFDVPRLREEDWFYKAGVRRKDRVGGRLEVAQQFGGRGSNSEFFFPNNQGNARLTLSYNQPLLNGAGKAYNNSLVVLANIDTQIAADRTKAELQDHLLKVTQAMWELYLQRAILLQKQRHLKRAQAILTRLEKRRGVDALASQISRARAAVAMRRAELIRAAAAIRNAEAQVRALVNSPDMLANRSLELVPVQTPTPQFVPVDLDDAVVTALEYRPEIDAATQEIEAMRVRLNVAQNELMPVLDLVLESYMSGLRGGQDVARSFVDQFSVGEPSWTAGLVFEVPLRRRAAKAEHQRRQLQVRQLSSQFQATVETLHAEVEVAVREVETSFREYEAKYESMKAADVDVRSLQRHWELLPGDDRAASFLLEDLLDAQDRLAVEEFGFAKSQVNYTVSLTRLNRATGTLLKQEQVQLLRVEDCYTPSIHFESHRTEELPRSR